jgi:hypothetical protein
MAPKSVLITVRTADDDWMLLRVSVICRVKVAAGERPREKTVPDYVKLEVKLCETCGRQFMRSIGSDVRHCAQPHIAPVRPGDLQRLEAALLEGKEAKRRHKGARIRVAARGASATS